MASVNLRHLHTFGEVARLGSVSAAARAVHISQPAVTQAVAGVERYFGAALLTRSNSGVALTPAGELCARRIERSISHLRELRFRCDAPDALGAPERARRGRRAPQLQSRRARAAHVAAERASRRARTRASHRRAAVREDELRHHADARSRKAGAARAPRVRRDRAGARRSSCAERRRVGSHRHRRDATCAQLPRADSVAGVHSTVSRASRRDRRRNL